MSNKAGRQDYPTDLSLLNKLNAQGTMIRASAWEQFRKFYAPIIAGFARNMGARPQDVDDVIQDVMLGFFSASSTFKYDRARGRERERDGEHLSEPSRALHDPTAMHDQSRSVAQGQRAVTAD